MTTPAWKRHLNRNVKQMHPDYAQRLYDSLSADRSICGPTAQFIREHLTGGYYCQAISIEVYRALYKRAQQTVVAATSN